MGRTDRHISLGNNHRGSEPRRGGRGTSTTGKKQGTGSQSIGNTRGLTTTDDEL